MELTIERTLRAAPVIPVLTIDNPDQAVPLAQTLVRAGLPVLEITLRTDAARSSIQRIIAEVPGAIVGAGTVISTTQANDVAKLGCAFAVSPGYSADLLRAVADIGLPFLPGVSTAAEAMQMAEHGYAMQKFFPAGPAGGVAFLRALKDPLPRIKFCPTGGVTAANALDYLALPNVVCVGGSWVAPEQLIAAGHWANIEALARSAAVLTPSGLTNPGARL